MPVGRGEANCEAEARDVEYFVERDDLSSDGSITSTIQLASKSHQGSQYLGGERPYVRCYLLQLPQGRVVGEALGECYSSVVC